MVEPEGIRKKKLGKQVSVFHSEGLHIQTVHIKQVSEDALLAKRVSGLLGIDCLSTLYVPLS